MLGGTKIKTRRHHSGLVSLGPQYQGTETTLGVDFCPASNSINRISATQLGRGSSPSYGSVTATVEASIDAKPTAEILATDAGSKYTM